MPILDELKKKANGKADSANNIAEAIAQMDFSEGSVTPEEIAESVSAYLDEHLTNPTNPPIDTSLTISGAAADAKETGDKYAQLKEDFNNNLSLLESGEITVDLVWTNKEYINRSGNAVTTTNTRFNATLDYIKIYKGTTLEIDVYAAGDADNVVIYNLDKTVRAYLNPTQAVEYTVTDDGYIRLSNDTNYKALSACSLKVVYDGTSIAEVDNAVDGINDRIDDMYYEGSDVLLSGWENKKYIASDGSIGNSTVYACTVDAQRLPSGTCKIKVKEGYECTKCYSYSKTSGVAGAHEEWSGGKAGEFYWTFDHYKYYRFQAKKSDGTAMETVPTDIVVYSQSSLINDSVITVHNGESILAKVKEAYTKNCKKVIVEAGEYNIISEYESFFGTDYFTNYDTQYNHQANGSFDFGLWIDDIEIYFSPGAKVIANYTGNNENVSYYFSAFACGNNVIIDGLVLDCTNLRYGIHPDFWDNRAFNTMIIRNCDLHCYRSSDETADNNSAIGAGLPIHGDWLIENCIFRSDTSNRVVRIHNNVESGAQSNVVIKNCYVVGNGHIEINSYGAETTKQTIAIVCGCNWVNPAVSNLDAPQSYSNYNVTLYSFCNETRT